MDAVGEPIDPEPDHPASARGPVSADQPASGDRPAGGPAPPEGLSERDVRILDFERRWWRQAGSKEQAIRDLFDLSATRYYQLLNAVIDNPAALAHDPVLVKRLRRLRANRRRARGASGEAGCA